MAAFDELQRFFKTIGIYTRETGDIIGYKYEMCYRDTSGTTFCQDQREIFVQIPRKLVAKVRGNNNRNFKDVVHKSGITTLRLVGDRDRDVESLRKEGHVPVQLHGRPECIGNAITMLENIMSKDKRTKERKEWLTALQHHYDNLLVKRIKLKSTLRKVPVNLKNLKRIAKVEDKLDEVEQELNNIKMNIKNSRRIKDIKKLDT